MTLRKLFLLLSAAITAMLLAIGGVTLGALDAFNAVTQAEQHRRDSMRFVEELREEVDLLGRLVSSYVSTADPRFLLYYYDILAVREGSKRAVEKWPASYWEQVVAGTRRYQPALAEPGQTLAERGSWLGLESREQHALRRVFQQTEQMKQTEQVAFAATQGLYDPNKREFVSESTPQPAFAARVLHENPYLQERAELALAVEELAALVDARTAGRTDDAAALLQRWIIAGLILLLGTLALLVFSYLYLRRHLLNPLTALHQTAEALAEGDFTARVGDLHGVAEVHSLAGTMDAMADAVNSDIARREANAAALSEARARAEVAAEAKSMFLANMSHEIRTPMNAILGMAYLAMKSGLPPRQHDYVSKIHGAARSLLGILNDILDFSKIEAGKVQLESTAFDVESVVQNALFMVQQRAEGKRVELILDYRLSGDFPDLQGDPLRIGQVLINLLSNAVKFTEAGHVRLVVDQLGQGEATRRIMFRVEDTGIGMSPEQLGRLFQEFTQADGSTTRKFGGTGLGLAISKRLVEAMGGDIRVDSVLGRGSAFQFMVELPVAVSTPALAPQLFGCHKTLVVDDYAAARESMAGILVLQGCARVDVAANGQEALARLRDAAATGQPYDLLLLDWMMPDLSGGEVIRQARAEGLPLPLRTVIVSAADAALLRAEPELSEVADVIQKPLLPNVLRRLCGCESASGLVAAVEAQRPLAGVRLLLVEDNLLNREVALDVLGEWGAQVDVAVDGENALKTLFSQRPETYQAVLMDIEMPVLDGIEATRRLRADPRYSNLPVIAMTAHALGEDLSQARAAGMNGQITKPFEPDALLASLRALQTSPEDTAASVTTSASEQQFLDALAQVPGLDAETLGRRFAGRMGFLARAMQHFAEDARGFITRLRAALIQGDLDGARRQAHSFKGLAGTFGLTTLQAAVLSLEGVVKSGNLEPAGEIAAVDELLQSIVPALVALPASVGESAPRVPRSEAYEVALARLRQRLSEGDGEAEDLWLTLRDEYGVRNSPRLRAALDRAIDQWSFDEALTLLDAGAHKGGGQ